MNQADCQPTNVFVTAAYLAPKHTVALRCKAAGSGQNGVLGTHITRIQLAGKVTWLLVTFQQNYPISFFKTIFMSWGQCFAYITVGSCQSHMLRAACCYRQALLSQRGLFLGPRMLLFAMEGRWHRSRLTSRVEGKINETDEGAEAWERDRRRARRNT